MAIVPFVFDGLNLQENIANQLDTYVGVTQDIYDGDSTAVEPYATAFASLDTPQGEALDQIIDPFSYINRPTYDIPKYMIDSTGDQFFTPGAQFYFGGLPGENYLDYVPNTDHSLDAAAFTSGVDFEKAVIDGAALPQFTWTVTNGGTEINLNTVSTPTSVLMWQATNPDDRDFRLETFGANWTSSVLTDQGGGNYVAQVSLPSSGATAFFIQMQYTVDGMTLTFTTQISTVPLFTPTVAVSDAGGVYNGNPFPASGTATGEVGEPVAGTYAYEYFAGSAATGPSSTTPPTAAGTYTVVGLFTSTESHVRRQPERTGDLHDQPADACSDRCRRWRTLRWRAVRGQRHGHGPEQFHGRRNLHVRVLHGQHRERERFVDSTHECRHLYRGRVVHQ